MTKPEKPIEEWGDYELFPIRIFQDRYSGTYTGGGWIATAGTMYDLAFAISHSDDLTASELWGRVSDHPWVAVGNTPEEACKKLHKKNTPNHP